MDRAERLMLLLSSLLLVVFLSSVVYAVVRYDIGLPTCITSMEPFADGEVIGRARLLATGLGATQCVKDATRAASPRGDRRVAACGDHENPPSCCRCSNDTHSVTRAVERSSGTKPRGTAKRSRRRFRVPLLIILRLADGDQ
jgi:hypothetical protein